MLVLVFLRNIAFPGKLANLIAIGCITHCLICSRLAYQDCFV